MLAPKLITDYFSLPPGSPDGGFEAGQDVTKPAKPNKPEETANQEKCDRGQKSTLGQLAESRDKKAADSRNNVTSRTLTHTSTVHATFA
jgi:hypothetical protein